MLWQVELPRQWAYVIHTQIMKGRATVIPLEWAWVSSCGRTLRCFFFFFFDVVLFVEARYDLLASSPSRFSSLRQTWSQTALFVEPGQWGIISKTPNSVFFATPSPSVASPAAAWHPGTVLTAFFSERSLVFFTHLFYGLRVQDLMSWNVLCSFSTGCQEVIFQGSWQPEPAQQDLWSNK